MQCLKLENMPHGKLSLFISFILLLVPSYIANCQCSIVTEQSKYVIGTTRIDITLYKVENPGPDTMYLWIDTLSHDTSEFDNFLNYIRKAPCECKRNWMIYDQVILHDGLFLNCNFMKKILPNEVFRIYCTKEAKIMESDIHCVSVETVSGIISIPANDRYLYESDFIILTKEPNEKPRD